MVNKLAAAAALIALVAATSAVAGPRWKLMPPAEYDHPYAGRLTVTRVDSQAKVRELCTNAQFHPQVGALACSRRVDSDCFIIIAPDDVILKAGFPPDVIKRHEIAHCNGWSGEHKDAYSHEDYLEGCVRWLRVSETDCRESLKGHMSGGKVSLELLKKR